MSPTIVYDDIINFISDQAMDYLFNFDKPRSFKQAINTYLFYAFLFLSFVGGMSLLGF